MCGVAVVKFTFIMLQFRFADGKDIALMLIGGLAAVTAGLTIPIQYVLFGDLTEAFVQHDGCGDADNNDTLKWVNNYYIHSLLSFAHFIHVFYLPHQRRPTSDESYCCCSCCTVNSAYSGQLRN